MIFFKLLENTNYNIDLYTLMLYAKKCFSRLIYKKFVFQLSKTFCSLFNIKKNNKTAQTTKYQIEKKRKKRIKNCRQPC